MAEPGAVILGCGLVSPVGAGVLQTWTSVRAGISGFAASSILSESLEPLVLALVPGDVLPALAPALEAGPGRTGRRRRLLRLAAAAFADLGPGAEFTLEAEPPPLYFALPETLPGFTGDWLEGWLDDLAVQLEGAGMPFDPGRSVALPGGRAAGLIALEQALAALDPASSPYALVAGADTWLDLRLLAQLGREGRLLGAGPSDGFVPGEGAAVLLLAHPELELPPGAEPLARIRGVGRAQESGHRYGSEPYRGEGLATAFAELFGKPEMLRRPVATEFAGLNGESFGAKEHGVAVVRSREHLDPALTLLHPADVFGDLGAAQGPALLALAALGLGRGEGAAPALVWCSSDGPERAAALVDTFAAE